MIWQKYIVNIKTKPSIIEMTSIRITTKNKKNKKIERERETHFVRTVQLETKKRLTKIANEIKYY